jgi:glycosyltransferase involved in cell wall biosynthesis
MGRAPVSRYVLVTACRNEARFIDDLVETVERQTLAPARWVIVDDGSADETYDLAVARTAHLPFARVLRMAGGRPRSFASQVFAARYGCEQLGDVDYDCVGFLDADIRIQPDYYERMLACMQADEALGLCGGAVIDAYADRMDYSTRRGSEDSHVPGGVQLFRRACFEEIGGYVPVEVGGQDTIADVMAMMHGWKVRAFTEYPVMHLRPLGVWGVSAVRRAMAAGRKFYLIGYHPVFYLAHCLRRFRHRPPIAASLWYLIGFAATACRHEHRPVDRNFVRFLHRVQMQRLRGQACLALAVAKAWLIAIATLGMSIVVAGVWMTASQPAVRCAAVEPSGAYEQTISAEQAVVRPWHGRHHVYAVFVVPDRDVETLHSATVIVCGVKIVATVGAGGAEDHGDGSAIAGRSTVHAHLRTRTALRLLATGHFADLSAPCNWTLVLPDRRS